MSHNFPIEEQLEQEWIAGGAHESFVSWLCDNLIEARSDGEVIKAMRVAIDNLTDTVMEVHHKRNAAIQRGDTYRRRAMAMRRQSQEWRFIAVLQNITWNVASNPDTPVTRADIQAMKREMVEGVKP